jgi:hypothetical protein
VDTFKVAYMQGHSSTEGYSRGVRQLSISHTSQPHPFNFTSRIAHEPRAEEGAVCVVGTRALNQVIARLPLIESTFLIDLRQPVDQLSLNTN